MDPTAILQRTSTGLETIKTKSIRLTQSERLILIVVDGVTPYAQLRERVWALSPERFTLALNTLLEKGLIFEVLLPDAGRLPEVLDSSVIDQFLQQDPLDPVTIISADPEDHFGTDLIARMGHAPSRPASSSSREKQSSPASGTPVPVPAHTAKDASPPRKNNPAAIVRHAPAGAGGPGAHVPSSASVQPKIPSPSPPRSAESAGTSRKPPPARASGSRRNTLPGNSAKSGSRADSHARSAARTTRTPKKQSVDVLKLCSWTGLVSGFAIFLFLLLHYTGAAL